MTRLNVRQQLGNRLCARCQKPMNENAKYAFPGNGEIRCLCTLCFVDGYGFDVLGNVVPRSQLHVSVS